MRIPERQRAGRFEERKEHGEREFPFTIYPLSLIHILSQAGISFSARVTL